MTFDSLPPDAKGSRIKQWNAMLSQTKMECSVSLRRGRVAMSDPHDQPDTCQVTLQ